MKNQFKPGLRGVRDDVRISRSSNRRFYWNASTSKYNPKMASVAMLIGGALVNFLAFTGRSYLFLRLSNDSINKERKIHDLAIEQLQKAQVEWVKKRQERINFIYKQLRLERKVETKFTELNDAMREYHKVFGDKFSPLPREPVLSDFCTPSNEQHDGEFAFITLSMIGIGGVLWYFE